MNLRLTPVIFGFVLASIFISVNAEAAVVLVGLAPAPREVIVAPTGYRGCYIVPAGYFNGRWITTHRECQYDNTPEIWVSAHWECHHFNAERGTCKRWSWAPSFWTGPQVAGPEYGPSPYEQGPPPPPPVMVAGPPVVAVAPPPVFIGFSDGPYHRHGWR